MALVFAGNYIVRTIRTAALWFPFQYDLLLVIFFIFYAFWSWHCVTNCWYPSGFFLGEILQQKKALPPRKEAFFGEKIGPLLPHYEDLFFFWKSPYLDNNLELLKS
jgi:hypothetical protein